MQQHLSRFGDKPELRVYRATRWQPIDTSITDFGVYLHVSRRFYGVRYGTFIPLYYKPSTFTAGHVACNFYKLLYFHFRARRHTRFLPASQRGSILQRNYACTSSFGIFDSC